MNKILFSALMIVFVATGFNAKAAEERWPRWYLGLSGSLNMLTDSDVSGPTRSTASFNSGWGASAAIGYKPYSDIPFFDSIRLEMEAAYRDNEVDKYSGTTVSRDNAKSQAYMLNAIYDIQTGTQFVPYFGAGLGWANVEFLNDSDNVFAYQALVGVGYEPVSIPNTMVSVGYRYFATQDANYSIRASNYTVDYNTHSLEAGLQFRF